MCKVHTETEKKAIKIYTEKLAKLTGKAIILESRKDCSCCAAKFSLKESKEIDEVKKEIAKLEKENKEGYAKEISKLKIKLLYLKKLNEGTWALPAGESEVIGEELIEKLKTIKSEAYNVFGDDEFFDGLDNAIERAEYLLSYAQSVKNGESTKQ